MSFISALRCREIIKFPFYTLKQVWSTVGFILENYEIQRVICRNFCVTNADIVFTFFSKNENLRCTCQQYGKTEGLCPHVVAIAVKGDLLETLFPCCIKTGENINKLLSNAPENAGDKPKLKKNKHWQNQHP